MNLLIPLAPLLFSRLTDLSSSILGFRRMGGCDDRHNECANHVLPDGKRQAFSPDAIFSKASQSEMRMLSDVTRIIRRLLRFESRRVTVSRDEQIICATCSCVNVLVIWIGRDLFVPEWHHSSNSLANFAFAVCGSSNDLARSVSSAISRLNICDIACAAG